MAISNEHDIELIKDTLAAVVRTIIRFAMDTPEFPLADFRGQLEQFVVSVLIRRPGENAIDDPDKHHRFVRNLINEQRRCENRLYTGIKDNSKAILTDFIKDLKASLLSRLEGDNQIVTNIQEIEKAAEGKDLDAIRKATKMAGDAIRSIIENQHNREKEQLSKLTVQLKSMREELRDTKVKLNTDPLTGIFNRQAINDSLPKAMSYSRLAGEGLALFIIDLDFFKQINDTFGHNGGDEALKGVAKGLVKSFFRKDDFVARYGGDEFLAYARNVTWEEIEKIGERTRQAVENLNILFDGKKIPTSCSIGYTMMSDEDTIESIIERADQALYQSKSDGRNCARGIPA
ncbi:diguanylate cyclase [Myxococcota bacterium]|nr:diguanylate cyclase [Myxococcota bacterium]MBU1380353.1 diguanylate cyclase [Myxococcota bacterium]MBU1498206.1 diguanylate cyclase [Myxococcota bacterium]